MSKTREDLMIEQTIERVNNLKPIIMGLIKKMNKEDFFTIMDVINYAEDIPCTGYHARTLLDILYDIYKDID